LGDRVDNKYIISRKIGHGSFGEVFVAKDVSKDVNVAVKVEKQTAKVP